MQGYAGSRSIKSNIYKWNGGGKSDHQVTNFLLDYQLELTPGEQEPGWKQGFGEEEPRDISLLVKGNHHIGPVVQGNGLFHSFLCH